MSAQTATAAVIAGIPTGGYRGRTQRVKTPLELLTEYQLAGERRAGNDTGQGRTLPEGEFLRNHRLPGMTFATHICQMAFDRKGMAYEYGS